MKDPVPSQGLDSHDKAGDTLLLRRFHHIRENDKFKNIKIDHDKTKQEREESKKLYEEAKRQEAADKSGEYLYRVRGPPWERKIRKIRKSQ